MFFQAFFTDCLGAFHLSNWLSPFLHDARWPASPSSLKTQNRDNFISIISTQKLSNSRTSLPRRSKDVWSEGGWGPSLFQSPSLRSLFKPKSNIFNIASNRYWLVLRWASKWSEGWGRGWRRNFFCEARETFSIWLNGFSLEISLNFSFYFIRKILLSGFRYRLLMELVKTLFTHNISLSRLRRETKQQTLTSLPEEERRSESRSRNIRAN